MSKIYEYFSEPNLDFSDEAALEAYTYETYGAGNLKNGLFGNSLNGFAIGKHWMDATVKMWKQDIRDGLLTKQELYNDPEFIEFKWWLDKIFKKGV